jgi:hypothetical protein
MLAAIQFRVTNLPACYLEYKTIILPFYVGMKFGRSWDSSVGIATSLVRVRQCIIFLFSTASRPTLGPTQPPIQWVTRALSPFPGGKAAGACS